MRTLAFCIRSFIIVFCCAAIALADERPTMTSLPQGINRLPPSARQLVDARVEFRSRYREVLFRAKSATGADLAAEFFIEEASREEDRPLKWLLLAEARRLGVASGNAVVISRSITLATATYDFDALELEYRSLDEIPLRGVSPQRAVGVAEAAEALATVAELDTRMDIALESQDLAIKAWQRAGAIELCRRAMKRHDELAAAAPEPTSASRRLLENQ
jgi:hypothetical protein